MKKNLHPDYHIIEIEMTNGKTFLTRSTWGKPNGHLVLDVDVTKHNAWSEKKTLNLQSRGQVVRFSKKFGGLNFGLSEDK